MSSGQSDNADSFYPGCEDPTCDLILECGQYGEERRVHSYLFKAHSVLFRGIPLDQRQGRKNGEQRTPVNCDPEHVDSLLRFLLKDAKNPYGLYGWADLEVVLGVGEELEFVHIPNLVRPYVYSCIDDKSAWEIAVFASRYNFLDIFKLALAALHNYDWSRWGQEELAIVHLETLIVRYATALVIAMCEHKQRQSGGERERWRKISESFEVKND